MSTKVARTKKPTAKAKVKKILPPTRKKLCQKAREIVTSRPSLAGWIPKIGEIVLIPAKVNEQVAVQDPKYYSHVDYVWKLFPPLSAGAMLGVVVANTQLRDLVKVKDISESNLNYGLWKIKNAKERFMLTSVLRPFNGWNELIDESGARDAFPKEESAVAVNNTEASSKLAAKNSDLARPRSTPLMKKYQSIKKEHPDAILLFRMGDFYELFFEDAQTASRVLGLTVTTRDKTSASPVPMAGFPHHQLDGYLRKLIKAGFRASVCEQAE